MSAVRGRWKGKRVWVPCGAAAVSAWKAVWISLFYMKNGKKPDTIAAQARRPAYVHFCGHGPWQGKGNKGEVCPGCKIRCIIRFTFGKPDGAFLMENCILFLHGWYRKSIFNIRRKTIMRNKKLVILTMAACMTAGLAAGCGAKSAGSWKKSKGHRK